MYCRTILTRLELCQTEITLLPEQEYQFKISGFDQFDKPIKIGRVKWKCSYGGTINQSGLFRGYYRKKIVTVTVSIDGVSITAKVTLLPVLRELLIGPKLINVKPGESQQFTVYGLDQYGDSIDPNDIYWDATGGTITQSGLFTAATQKFIHRQLRKQVTRCLDQISRFSLRLAEAKVSASVNVNIVPILRSIKIQPSYQDIKQGEKCQFKGYELDQDNESITSTKDQYIKESLHNNYEKQKDDDLGNNSSDLSNISQTAIISRNTYSIFEKTHIVSTFQVNTSNPWFRRSQLLYDGYSDNEGISYQEYLEYVDQRGLIDRLL